MIMILFIVIAAKSAQRDILMESMGLQHVTDVVAVNE